MKSRERFVNIRAGSFAATPSMENSVPQGHRLIIGERSFAQV